MCAWVLGYDIMRLRKRVHPRSMRYPWRPLKQRFPVILFWRAEPLVAATPFEDVTVLHGHHLAAKLLHHGEVVEDEQIGEIQLVAGLRSSITACAWMETSGADTDSQS